MIEISIQASGTEFSVCIKTVILKISLACLDSKTMLLMQK